MLHNKRKTIGVLAERVKDEFQMRLCQGFMEAAEQLVYYVAIFSFFV